MYFVFINAKFYKSINESTQNELDDLRASLRRSSQPDEFDDEHRFDKDKFFKDTVKHFRSRSGLNWEGFLNAWQRLVFFAADEDLETISYVVVKGLCKRRKYFDAYREEIGFLMEGNFGGRQPSPRVWTLALVEELIELLRDFHLRLRHLRKFYNQPLIKVAKDWNTKLQDHDVSRHPADPRIPDAVTKQFELDPSPQPIELARECTATEWNRRHPKLKVSEEVSANRVGKIVKEYNRQRARMSFANSTVRRFGDLFAWTFPEEKDLVPDCYPNCNDCFNQNAKDRPLNCLLNQTVVESENGAPFS
jgi:hypothetical protein